MRVEWLAAWDDVYLQDELGDLRVLRLEKQRSVDDDGAERQGAEAKRTI